MKKNIAIVAGGDSSEHIISINSAKQINKVLDKEKYNIYTVIIKETKWVVNSDSFENLAADFSEGLKMQLPKLANNEAVFNQIKNRCKGFFLYGLHFIFGFNESGCDITA